MRMCRKMMRTSGIGPEAPVGEKPARGLAFGLETGFPIGICAKSIRMSGPAQPVYAFLTLQSYHPGVLKVAGKSVFPARNACVATVAFARKGAAMGTSQSLISELDTAIQSSSSDKRIATLRRVTDLFLSHAGQYDPAQMKLFDGVLMRMIGHIETRALAELGERLAPIEGAPIEVIRHLAKHDEIVVAGPVLKESKQLTSGDLVKIAREKSQDHLLAISERSEIDEAVTDVLVDRGNSEVARKVAVNSGARFSENGFATLVKRAEKDDVLAEATGRRVDIPPQMYAQLLAKATETVKAKLMAARPEAADVVQRTLGKVARELQDDRPARDYTEAQHLVALMNREGRLSEAAVLEFARTNKFEEAIAALALRCTAPIDIIDRLMQGNRIDALLIPCKAAGLAWPTTRAIIRLNPVHNLTTEDAFEAAKQDFTKLSVAAAQRIMRFWQVRSSVTPGTLPPMPA